MTTPTTSVEAAAPAFEVRDVKYRYQQVVALDGLSLTVQSGRRLALLGANGSGKSTLLRLLDGLCFPDQGSVRFYGEPLTEERLEDAAFGFEFRRRVGLIFQNPDVQLFSPSVFDEVAFGPLQLRWPNDSIRRSVLETLETMEITHLKDRSPHHLSTGEKKRVALASVLILNPEVLLLDEPTAALDPRSHSQMINFLVSWGGGSKTVVIATHDLDHVEDIADDCCVFQDGRVAAEGPPETILADEPLLALTNLLHAHRHVHSTGAVHTHPHTHPHEH
ncbi:MAG: energy-coupling factor ABC transporter ATP-binding protein [Terriglobia bacterium]